MSFLWNIERDEYGDEVEVLKEIRGYKEYRNCTAFHRGNLAKLDMNFAVDLAECNAKVLDIRTNKASNEK